MFWEAAVGMAVRSPLMVTFLIEGWAIGGGVFSERGAEGCRSKVNREPSPLPSLPAARPTSKQAPTTDLSITSGPLERPSPYPGNREALSTIALTLMKI